MRPIEQEALFEQLLHLMEKPLRNPKCFYELPGKLVMKTDHETGVMKN